MLYFAIAAAAVAAAVAIIFIFTRRSEPEADIDLRGKNRPILRVRLPKMRGTLLLTTPTKSMADALSNLGDLLSRIGQGSTKAADMRELYRACALILSDNRKHRKITAQHLAKTMTPDDCIDFLGEYLGWLTTLTSEKN